MDVDAAAGEFRRQPVRQHLHVAREHDDLGFRIADQTPDLGLLFHLGLARHRQMMEGNAVEIDMFVGLASMIGDDAHRLHVQLADPPAIDEVDEAMIRFGDEDHHALLVRAGPHQPCEVEVLRDPGKIRAQRLVFRGLADAIEHDAREELAGFGRIELLRVENVATVPEQTCRHGRDDAGPVGAGKGENILRAVWHDCVCRYAAPIGAFGMARDRPRNSAIAAPASVATETS